MTQAPTSHKKDIVGVQYLRGIAAIMVVIFHIGYQIEKMYPLSRLESLASGVDIFFVISGFVMIYSTYGGSRFSPLEFFLHRLARIAPLYWAATLATILALIYAPGLVTTARLSYPHAILSLLFIAAPNPVGSFISPLVVVGWTLNLEMFFYVIFAASIAVGSRSPRRVSGYVLVTLVALAMAGLILRPQGIPGFYVNPVLLEFAFGVALAWAYLRVPRQWPRWAAWLALAAILLLLLSPESSATFRCFRYGLPAAVLVAIATRVDLPRWRPLHRLGDISYSLYISHFFTLSALAQLWRKLPGDHGMAGVAGFYVVGAICAVAVAYLCWRLVEKPLTSLTKRLLTIGRGARADAPVPAL